jgi:HupE/UreJ protein
MRLMVFLMLTLSVLGTPALAHEIRPAYLSLTESRPSEFEVLWKVPALLGGVLAVDPALPVSCIATTPQYPEDAGGALIARWRIRCPRGLGDSIAVSGLDRTLTSAFVHVQWRDGRVVEGIVTGAEPSLSISRQAPPAVLAYVGLGVWHILGGLDHVGFVAGLMLIVVGWRRLLATLSAFTIAHSLTLGASALGLVSLPQRAVEVVIAFSIAVAAREAWFAMQGRGGLAGRAPWIIAFGFGLLHGFGFASALSQIGLPQNAKLEALVLFNVGVEVGQVLVVSVLAPVLFVVRTYSPEYRVRFGQTVSIILGVASFYWLCERLFL